MVLVLNQCVLRQSTGAAFSPEQLFTSERGFFFDFTDTTKLTIGKDGTGGNVASAGDLVGRAIDKSPNGCTLSASTDADRGTWGGGSYVGGLYFAGAGTKTYTASSGIGKRPFSSPSAYTCITAAHFLTYNSTSDWWVSSGFNATGGFITNGGQFRAYYENSYDVRSAGKRLMVVMNDNTASAYRKHDAGSKSTFSTSPGTSNSDTQAAVNSELRVLFWLVIQRALTDAEVGQVETWAGTKFGSWG